MLNDVKLNNILQILDDNLIDIACISETWFDSSNGKFTATIKEAGFDIIHAHREHSRGGGTAIMYRNVNMKKGESSTCKFVSFEYSYTLITLASRAKLILTCVYRKQEISCITFCDELENFLEDIIGKCDMMMLVGDFNVWIDVIDNVDAKRLMTVMNAYGLSQIVREPTHIGGHTLIMYMSTNTKLM